MKCNFSWLTGFMLLMLAGVLISGCASMDSMSYVREHKGEGTRHSVQGNEAELMDLAAKSIEADYYIVKEPHALFGKAKNVELSYAFYFDPSPDKNQTDVEVLVASHWFDPKTRRYFEQESFLIGFTAGYLNMRLQEEGFDPNLKKGSMFPLTAAALFGYPDLAKKLISRKADPELAIAELKEIASRNVPYLDKPANKQSYEKANLGAELLVKLQKLARQNDGETANESRFKAALLAYQAAPVKLELPEEARRFKVQAENAVREKDFHVAVDLYQKALNVFPLWPEGHFNRSLVLAETGNFEAAIREMKRYLLLAPNSSNARAAQDNIYVWESKTGDQK